MLNHAIPKKRFIEQVNSETDPIFYSTNSFPLHTDFWLRTVSKKVWLIILNFNVKKLKKIEKMYVGILKLTI